MAITTGWKGLPTVLRNLSKQLDKIEGGSLEGLIKSAAYIKGSVDVFSPLIPVDTGNLRASWFVVTNKGSVVDGRNPLFVMGDKGDRDVGKLLSGHTSTVNFVSRKIQGKNPTVGLGFSAYYAVHVHENFSDTFHRPDSGPLFLESAIKNSAKQILAIVRSEAKIR